VVEFRVQPQDIEYHTQKVKEHFEYQILNNRIRLFIPEGTEGKSTMHLIASPSISVRRATLNDVFLKLAGYELREGA
jgi:hypothetical protein